MHVQSLPLSRPLHGVGRSERDVVARTGPWGWPELFVAIQLLWGLVLFVPGAQTYRVFIRALPYVVSGASLVYYFRRPTGQRLPGSTAWLLGSFAVLVVGLAQPTTHLAAGLAQIVFQVSIAAPAFWMARAVTDERRLENFVRVLFYASCAAAVVGVLQVYFPEQFLPPEFSTLALTLNSDIVGSLTYIGADGRAIIRPPGLSDVPGGAAVAGMLTVVLGLTLGRRFRQSWTATALCLAAAAIGMTVLFLTHVRSLSLLAAGGVLLGVGLRFRRGRTLEGVVWLVVGMAVLTAAYLWAVSVGGEAVSERFAGLFGEGLFQTFDESRGLFIKYTFTELLFEFPFGAGLGRWGMMYVLFGDQTMWQAPPIHVEIQPTGWLLDGGVPLLLLYSGAVFVALRASYRLISDPASPLRDLSSVLGCVQVCLAALCLTGPAFNNQLGILFWSVTGALHGAASMRSAGRSTPAYRRAA